MGAARQCAVLRCSMIPVKHRKERAREKPLGHQTHLKAKAGGENSMFGKAGRSETVKLRAGRGPDGMAKPVLVESQASTL